MSWAARWSVPLVFVVLQESQSPREERIRNHAQPMGRRRRCQPRPPSSPSLPSWLPSRVFYVRRIHRSSTAVCHRLVAGPSGASRPSPFSSMISTVAGRRTLPNGPPLLTVFFVRTIKRIIQSSRSSRASVRPRARSSRCPTPSGGSQQRVRRRPLTQYKSAWTIVAAASMLDQRSIPYSYSRRPSTQQPRRPRPPLMQPEKVRRLLSSGTRPRQNCPQAGPADRLDCRLDAVPSFLTRYAPFYPQSPINITLT